MALPDHPSSGSTVCPNVLSLAGSVSCFIFSIALIAHWIYLILFMCLFICSQPWTPSPVGAETRSVFLLTASPAPDSVHCTGWGFSKYWWGWFREFHEGVPNGNYLMSIHSVPDTWMDTSPMSSLCLTDKETEAQKSLVTNGWQMMKAGCELRCGWFGDARPPPWRH